MSLLDQTIQENDDSNNNGNVGFAGGERGFVTTLPINPLFRFKANGQYTYNTDYLLPLDVSGSDDQISLSGDPTTADLPNGFDSLALGATVTDTFQVTYTTGEGTTTESVTVTIEGVNDDPTAVDDVFGTVIPNTDGATEITGLLANDFDIDVFDNENVVDADNDGDTFFITSVTQGTYGTVTLNGAGEVFYDPTDTTFSGIDTFTYTIEDQHGATSNTATVTVVVGPSNIKPIAGDDIPSNGVSYSVMEDDASATTFNAAVGVLNNDSDPDGDPLGALLISSPELYYSDASGVELLVDPTGATGTGSLTFRTDGSFDYDPGGNFEYLAEGEFEFVGFEYRAFDGDLNTSDDAVAVIKIVGENDDPEAVDPAAETVYEAGLAADGSGEELPVSFPTGETATTVTGTIVVTDVDLSDTHSITHVDGAPIVGGMVVGTGYKLTFSGLTYTYELTDNRTGHTSDGRNADNVKDTFALTITDSSGGTDVVNLVVNIVDDAPEIATDFTVGSITHDETPGITGDTTNDDSGLNTAQVTNIVSGLSTAITPGADGVGTPTYSLTDSTGAAHNGTATNLFDTQTGFRIFLYTNGSADVEGRVGSGTGTGDALVGGTVAFTLELLNGDADSVDAKLTQARAIDHPNDSNPNDSVTLLDPTGTNALIHVSVTVIDGDTSVSTDTVTETSDDALGVIFIDDAPALTSIESGFVVFENGKTGLGDSTGLDFGFDGKGLVDLTAFDTSVAVKDNEGNTLFTLTGAETSAGSNVVEYKAPDGDGGTDTYFTFTLDKMTGDYTFEVNGELPNLENDVDLGGTKAGAPTERVEFQTDTATTVGIVAFNSVNDPNATNDDDMEGMMVIGDIKAAIDAGDSTALLNASNNGLAIDNQNTNQGEAYVIDTSISTAGFVITVGKATGGIGSVTFNWEAYDSAGNLIYESVQTVNNIPSGNGSVEVRFDIPEEFGLADVYYLNPEISNGKGGFAIPTLKVIERGSVDDFEFDFSAEAIDEDGDKTADVDFTIAVDGDGDGVTGFTELDYLMV